MNQASHTSAGMPVILFSPTSVDACATCAPPHLGFTALCLSATNAVASLKNKIISGLRGLGENTNICKLAMLVAISLGVAPVTALAQASAPIEWKVSAGGNGHWYGLYLVPGDSQSPEVHFEAAAVRGGHTVTITSAAENTFVFQVSAGSGALIGLRKSIGGNWITGEPWIYSNWRSGEGTNSWERYALLPSTWNGEWLDTDLTPRLSSLIEWEADCNGDGIVDYGQIQRGELPDTNGNAVPDCCENGGSCNTDTDADGVPDYRDNCVNIANPSQADCDNDGIGDACEIAVGNGSPYPGAVQWTVASGGNGHWYYFDQNVLHWEPHRDHAVSLGGYLATITSAAELQFIESDVIYVQGSDIWLGCHSQWPASPVWITGEQFSFAKWLINQPNWGGGYAVEICGRSTNCTPQFGWSVESESDLGWAGNKSIIEWESGIATEFDCNNNGIPDSCEMANGGDCNNNGQLDTCEIANNTAGDCDGDGIPNSCEIAAGALDADLNGIPDGCEGDCNVNGQLDYIDIALGAADCDNNGMIDSCEDGSGIYRNSGNLGNIGSGVPRFVTFATLPAAVTSVTLEVSARANLSAINRFLIMKLNGGASTYLFQTTGTDCPSTANTYARTFTASEFNTLTASGSLAVAFTAPGTVNAASCGSNALLEVRLAYEQAFTDCDNDGVRDFCAIDSGAVKDCNRNGIPDSCDIATGFAKDCNGNGIPDSCDIATGFAKDCNGNGIPDSCDIATGFAKDCNGNGVPDNCDITAGTAIDCNSNGIPDSCDIASGRSNDLNGDSRPDECEADCNHNNKPDAWEVATNQTPDCNSNGVPDSCDIESGTARDCNLNGVPDSCDIAAGALDENSDGRIDACNYAVGDFDLNNNIDSADLGFLLIFMGEANPPFGDFDTNGFCDSGDVGYLLLNMGPLE